MVYFVLLFLVFFGLYFFLQKRLSESFKALSFDLLEKNNRSFLDLASTFFEKHTERATTSFEGQQNSLKEALLPIKDSLKKLEEHNREIELQRVSAYSSLTKQVDAMLESEKLLRQEAANLSGALRSPNVRGAWGQIHLRRVVELAGLLDNCDFNEQVSVLSDEKLFRPDVVVKLPGERRIVIDAKTPIESYLESQEIKDERLRKEKLLAYAKTLRKHIKDLSSKEYWKLFSFSPEYVILFLPAESFFSAALQEDPALLEIGAKENVVIATPTTLIAILRAVAFSWKQEMISKNSKEIAKLGQDLYERLHVMNNHFQKLGKTLSSSIDAYNGAISSLESRVLVSAKKLKEICSCQEDEEDALEQITKTTRSLD